MGRASRQSIENEAGDFIYIEPGVPHEVFNLSDSEPVVAVVARSDASEWENIVPYDRTSSAVALPDGLTSDHSNRLDRRSSRQWKPDLELRHLDCVVPKPPHFFIRRVIR